MTILRTNQRTQRFFLLCIVLPGILLCSSGFIEDKSPIFIASLKNGTHYPLDKSYKHPLSSSADKPNISSPDGEVFDTFREFSEELHPEHGASVPVEKFMIHEVKHDTPKLKIFLANLAGESDDFSSLRKQPTEYFADVTHVQSSLAKRKQEYLRYINQYANKYELNHDMIYSIISVESNFRPLAKSKKQAYGLMQVVASTAGIEVNRYLKKKGKPNRGELLHPKTNIRYGTTYIYLVRKYHLAGIKNPKSRDILLIASYNAGAGAVMRHFGRTRLQAVKKINSMTPESILKSMLTSYRSGETRRYLERVLMEMQVASS